MFDNYYKPMPSQALALPLTLTLALALALTLTGCGGGSSTFGLAEVNAEEADYAYTIPLGAGEALDRGEPLAILPGSLEVKVGEIIEIVNQDNRGHLIGPFFVGANETVRQQFSSPGEYEGVCSVHPSGRLVLKVT